MPFTLSEMVQEALAASVPLERVTEPEPAAAVTVPLQVVLRPLGVATTRPAGSASLKLTPVRPRVVFGLLILKVSEVLAFKIGR